MKKTVSVNIKGINFLIEEDAYELLQDYMDRLTIALQNEDGSKEIIEDVELRIAEISSEKLSDTKTVIELADIESILAALGNPEEFIDDEEGTRSSDGESINDTHSKTNANTGKRDRRLFRDGESATLGGVCAGIANYFGIDVVIIRAIFLVFLLFGGFGFPLYIILWIIIPKAESTIDKLRMRGRPITVESVKQEVEDAAERLKDGSKSFSNRMRHDQSYNNRVSRGKRILSSIVGIWFLGTGLVISIFFTIFIIGGFEFLPVNGDSGFISLTEFGNLVLSNSGDVRLAWIGGLTMTLSSILFCFLLGTLLLFKIKFKWSKWTLGGLFLTGIVGLLITASLGIRTGRDFAFPGDTPISIGTTDQKELIIIPRINGQISSSIYGSGRHGDFMFIELDQNKIKARGINIQYIPSADTLFHVREVLTARGPSSKSALLKSKNIIHATDLVNDTLYVDVEYMFPQKDKLRDQEVTIVVEIPDGHSVRIRNRRIHLANAISQEGDIVRGPRYYKEEGKIRGDGSYDHYYDRYDNDYFDDDYDSDLEREIKEEILNELNID